MTQHFFIGVDGGATKSLIRLENEAGQVLGHALSGPANIRLSVEAAWQAILAGIETVLQGANIVPNQDPVLHVGMGLAGCEITAAYEAFCHHAHPFATLVVVSDAYTACLGAHDGEDGAIIVAGTGVVGLQIQSDEITKVSGHGFPHDDEGGGASLGLEAVKVTLQWLDGRLPESGLAKAVHAHFSQSQDRLVNWANDANSTAFATLAPLVIREAKAGDGQAIVLLKQAAAAIDRVASALALAARPTHSPLPCSLVGGIAPFLEPYLGAALRARLRPCLLPPEAGAVLLVRQALKHHKDTHDRK